jgi:hypothetical protein
MGGVDVYKISGIRNTRNARQATMEGWNGVHNSKGFIYRRE